MNDIWNVIKEKADGLTGSEIQRKVKSILSSTSYGVSTSEKSEIARATTNYREFREVMDIIWEKLNPYKNNHWKVIVHALSLLEGLVRLGSDHVVSEATDRQYAIKELFNYSVMDEGRERGAGIRDSSKRLFDLLNDSSRLKEIRNETKRNFSKYSQHISSEGSYGDYSSSNYSSDDPWKDTNRFSYSNRASRRDFGFEKPTPIESFSPDREENEEKVEKKVKKKKKKKVSIAINEVKEEENGKSMTSSTSQMTSSMNDMDDFDPRGGVSSKEKEADPFDDWTSASNSGISSKLPFDDWSSAPSSLPKTDNLIPTVTSSSSNSIHFDDWMTSSTFTSAPPKSIPSADSFDFFDNTISSANTSSPNPTPYAVGSNVNNIPSNTKDVNDFLSISEPPLKEAPKEKETPIFSIPFQETAQPPKETKKTDICWDSSLVNFDNLNAGNTDNKDKEKERIAQTERDILYMRPNININYRPPINNPYGMGTMQPPPYGQPYGYPPRQYPPQQYPPQPFY